MAPGAALAARSRALSPESSSWRWVMGLAGFSALRRCDHHGGHALGLSSAAGLEPHRMRSARPATNALRAQRMSHVQRCVDLSVCVSSHRSQNDAPPTTGNHWPSSCRWSPRGPAGNSKPRTEVGAR